MNNLDDILQRIKDVNDVEKEFEELYSLQDSMVNFTKEIEKAERNYDLNFAAELKYGVVAKVQSQIEDVKNRIRLKIALTMKTVLEEF